MDFLGLKVISFESRRAFEMQSLIERNGGKPFIAPSLREIPFELNQEAIAFAKKIIEDKADIVILMTGVGTRFLIEVISKQFSKETFLEHFANKTIVARGPKPVSALKEIGLKPTLTAPEPNTWREILKILDDYGSIKEKKVFVQEYGIQNQEFIEELKKRGGHVSRVPVYRWALPEDLGPLRQAISDVTEGKADILLFTSATQAYHLLQVAAEDGLENSFREALGRVAIASIGPVTSENLADCGLGADFEATQSKMGLFVKEVAEKCPEILKKKRAIWEAKSKPIEIKKYEIKSTNLVPLKESVFLKACHQEKTPYTPIWLMRQAGRFMKEYRELRARVPFIKLCKDSDLACEVTVTAQEKLGVDAAILFSDILLILEPMGVGLEYTKEEGPHIHRPVRTEEAVDNMSPVNVQESLHFVFEAVKKIRSALKPNVPLIGFAGAPFTLASYVVEGGPSQNYRHTKNLMHMYPQVWNKLMEKLTDSTIQYLQGQIDSGVQAVQVFDSWVGCLSPEDYREYVQPHMKKLFSSLEGKKGKGTVPSGTVPFSPLIHFGTGTSGLLELMKEAGGNVIGVDWRIDLATAWNRLGAVAVQGNLDPLVLLADTKTIRSQVKKILDSVKGRPGHIFNLGHGVLPQTPEENVRALVDMVHELSLR